LNVCGLHRVAYVRGSLTLLLGFAGMLGLLLTAFLLITWLFSASTKSALFLTWMNLLLWICAVSFAMRFLNLATRGAGPSARTIVFWSILFLLVSMQMTTHLRPILWDPGADFFEANKLSFFDHLAKLK
jgi:hypothetical protein